MEIAMSPKQARVIKTTEDDVTIYQIIGLENNPKAFKNTYLELLNLIKLNMLKIVSAGESIPVIRTHQSLEIH